MFLLPMKNVKLKRMTGADFKKWRKAQGLTQEALMEALDVTKMTVYRWENDLAPISRTVELALKQLEQEKKAS